MIQAPILAYHLISDSFDLGIARSSRRQFCEQMAWLAANGYSTVTLCQLLAGGSRGRCSTEGQEERRLVALTFDDAYASLADVADIMIQFGFVGTCFVISDHIGRLNTWDYQFFVRKHRHADRETLEALSRLGWEIGSHTKSHPYLPALPALELSQELRCSKEHLEDLLGSAILTISYPFGRSNKRVCTLARKLGYQGGVGLGLSYKEYQNLGKMCLPRVGIYLTDRLCSFAKKMDNSPAAVLKSIRRQQVISRLSLGTVMLKRIRRGLGRR